MFLKKKKKKGGGGGGGAWPPTDLLSFAIDHENLIVQFFGIGNLIVRFSNQYLLDRGVLKKSSFFNFSRFSNFSKFSNLSRFSNFSRSSILSRFYISQGSPFFKVLHFSRFFQGSLFLKVLHQTTLEKCYFQDGHL